MKRPEFTCLCVAVIFLVAVLAIFGYAAWHDWHMAWPR